MPRSIRVGDGTLQSSTEVPAMRSSQQNGNDFDLEMEQINLPVTAFAQPEEEEEKKEEKEEEEEKLSTEGELEVFLEDEFENLDSSSEISCFTTKVEPFLQKLNLLLTRCAPILKICLAFALLIAYAVYFGFAMYRERLTTDGSVRLLVMTCAAVGIFLMQKLVATKTFAACTDSVSWKMHDLQLRHSTAVSVIGKVAFAVYFCGIVIIIGSQDARNLVSAGGVFAIVLLAVVLSAFPTKINWRPVMGGLTLQITFAALLLRTEFGYATFQYIADRVAEFISHIDSGSQFVFGESFRDHFFAFSVLSVIVFFSSFIALLFHIGVLQAIIRVLGNCMQFAMGTTAAESLVAAANIFIGQTEAPFLIRPFVGKLTNSELHAVITSGYATIAGGVLAAYIGLGVPPQHLLSASVMVAPGALALSKIMYPETKKSKTSSEAIRKVKGDVVVVCLMPKLRICVNVFVISFMMITGTASLTYSFTD